MSRLGLYLHIPFCRKKCVYCDFSSYSGLDHLQRPVVEKMKGELQSFRQKLGNRSPNTVYVGGGTPSVLPPSLFSELLHCARSCFPWEDGAEVSVEMNPGTVSAEFVRAAVASGIKRVSLGAQSSNDLLLKRIGRIHQMSDVTHSVELLRAEGTTNINLDMMIGLPGQTIDDVYRTIDDFLLLQPKHISCYSLILEEGTPLYEAVSSGRELLPDEDTEREMYASAVQRLEQAGFHQYEISNFALDGYQCRHNLDCWHREEYIGIGVAAAGFLGNIRYRNPSSIQEYLSDEAPEITELSGEDERFESVMLGLRLTQGLSEEDFFSQHAVSLRDCYGATIQKLIGSGLLEFRDGYLRCTYRGFDLHNMVLGEFLP